MSISATALFFLFFLPEYLAFPDKGKWDIILTEKNSGFCIPKSMYKESQIYIQVSCSPNQPDVNISIQWTLTQTLCWQDMQAHDLFPLDYPLQISDNETLNRVQSQPIQAHCSHGSHVVLPQADQPALAAAPPAPGAPPMHPMSVGDRPVYTIQADGIYLLEVKVQAAADSLVRSFNVSTAVKMRAPYGYLSAVDWPLLPFYTVMCCVYVVLGVAWLVVCWLQWRDLLRIQFWIGAVLLLGMLEKATFLAEYNSMNSTGEVHRGQLLAAEWVSVAKRTLARMLVIIVSLGFGIVKPRLGPMLQRVVAVGAMYGSLAALEAWLRVGRNPSGPGGADALLAGAPLALLDAALCWWVFASLVHTTRTLRLRRNTVKLALYKHFTNTLIFAVASSMIFMLYSIQARGFSTCYQDWKEIWMDDAYWHVLFSTVLGVIMVLWRPTNNNQRYAFTPLLDNPDDDDDEEDQFVSDAYGVKMRGTSSSFSSSGPLLGSGGSGMERAERAERDQRDLDQPALTAQQREEADLRWVEDNIPAAALPVLDSDEEILNAKFEVSKMQ